MESLGCGNIGFGSEVTAWCIDYAFRELGQHRFSLTVFGVNTRATDLYRRMAFKQEGVKRKVNWNHGKWEDIICMVILNAKWEVRRKEEKEFEGRGATNACDLLYERELLISKE
ncbi:hypothetical protein BDZ89DRAFT_1043302 [Hymenopellis radicata]|nr:hypothetical protein BDZ89DRAFT_1043302 [Hymenopellis radicata]